MANPGSVALQRQDLAAFLFADVGIERNGMALTIMSVLARLGEDPWEEAGRLATLRKATATKDLAQIIVQIPTGSWNLTEATTIAARLVRLLPSLSSGSQSPTMVLKSGTSDVAWIGTALLYGMLGASLVLNMVVQRAHVADRSAVAATAVPNLEVSKVPASPISERLGGRIAGD